MTAFSLADKRAIITGSTRGIGKAIAEAFVAAGARVVISSENATDTRCAASELGQPGICADVTDDKALERLVEGSLVALGGLDILVCNAGIPGHPGPFAEMDLTDYDRVMALNLRSQVVLTQLALPHIAAQGRGSVVLMASISALRGNGAISAYALSKAGVAQLARNLAVEWGPRNVRVNALAPGFIATELSRPLLEDAEFMRRRLQMTPLRRPGLPDEVAHAAQFLASEASSFVTGQTLVIDGGTVITDGT